MKIRILFFIWFREPSRLKKGQKNVVAVLLGSLQWVMDWVRASATTVKRDITHRQGIHSVLHVQGENTRVNLDRDSAGNVWKAPFRYIELKKGVSVSFVVVAPNCWLFTPIWNYADPKKKDLVSDINHTTKKIIYNQNIWTDINA